MNYKKSEIKQQHSFSLVALSDPIRHYLLMCLQLTCISIEILDRFKFENPCNILIPKHECS